jgi:hypothetical protein
MPDFIDYGTGRASARAGRRRWPHFALLAVALLAPLAAHALPFYSYEMLLSRLGCNFFTAERLGYVAARLVPVVLCAAGAVSSLVLAAFGAGTSRVMYLILCCVNVVEGAFFARAAASDPFFAAGS